MTAPLVAERAGTVVIPAPAGGRLTAGALASYERDPAEQWAGEAVLYAATARVGRDELRALLRQLDRKRALTDARLRLGHRLTGREEAAWRRLVNRVRHLEALEASLARVVRQYEDQQALRLVRL